MVLKCKLLVSLLLTCALAHAQELVKDINPIPDGQLTGDLDYVNRCKPCGGLVYFVGREKEHGTQLWSTDGTAEGTTRLTNYTNDPHDAIVPGVLDGSYCLNGSLYYNDNLGGLLKITGKTIEKIEDGYVSWTKIVFKNKVIYNINESVYATDGQPHNGTLIKTFELKPGTTAVGVYDMEASADMLYMTVLYNDSSDPDQIAFMEVWGWDGTNMTLLFTANDIILQPTVANGKLYFDGVDDDHGRELWVSDGTVVGTSLLIDANPGPDDSNMFIKEVVDDKVVFNTFTPSEKLWVTDGTPGNTFSFYDGLNAIDIQKYHDHVYISGVKNPNGTYMVIRTDLDFANVETVVPEYATSLWTGYFTIVNDKLLYTHEDPTVGLELFRIDDLTLTLVKDIYTGPTGGAPRTFNEFGTKSVFMAQDEQHGFELWITDGTEEGTSMIIDLASGTLDPVLSEFYQYNKKIYFIARSGLAGQEVWTSDGTDAGTYPIFADDALSKDLMFGINNYVITTANGFVKIDVDTEDATPLALPEGYTNYVEIHAQPGLYIGDEVFFNTAAGPSPTETNGIELWKADVSTNEITLIKDINPGPEGSVIYAEKPKFNGMGVVLGNKIIFPASTADGMEPWVSDGTEEGTVMLKNIRGSGDSFPRSFTVMNDQVFFIALSDTEGSELWVTDGTPEGTHLVKDIAPGDKDGILTEPLTVYADRMFFIATTDGSESKLALWTSDGTPEGTQQYETLIPEGWTVTANIFAAGDYLYFFATHKDFGNELWSTDGTVEGTTLIELEPGAGGSMANDFINANGTLFFSTNGKIWRSLGTPESTVFLGEAYPVSELMLTDEYMVFKVDDPYYGRELFRVSLTGPVGQLITFTGFTNLKPGNEYEVSVRASSGLPVDLVSSDPSVIEISGTKIIVHKPGTVTFTATQGGDVDFKSTTETLTVVIEGLTQEITFNAIANKTMLDAKFTVDAQASSGLALIFESSDATIASIDTNGEITLLKAGTVTITASQPGNDAFKAADPISRTFSISKVDQSITFNDISTKTVGGGSFTLSATTSSSLPVQYATSSNTISINGSEVQLVDAGHATITASQPGNNVYNAASLVSKTFCINPAKPTITQTGLTAVTLTSSAIENVWLLNNTPLTFVGQQFVVTQEGLYKAAATADGCQGEFSDVVTVVITGLEDDANNFVELYPNPVQKTLFVKTKVSGLVRISDMTGREKHSEFITGDTYIEVSHYVEGMYIFTLNNKTIKFIKK